MTRIGTFAIIFDEEGRILLGHRRDMDLWNLPGGAAESGEMPHEAVVREVREETGLEVRVSKLVGIYGKTDKDDLIFLFRCAIIGGVLRQITTETDANRFFPPQALPPNLIPKHRERIADALAGHAQPIFRRQSGPDARAFLAARRSPTSSHSPSP
jgi:ADP-ribose pyrophosphatase YjhB (NUDIX family)